MVPYVVHLQNVLGDGNCGFRALAVLLGFDEEQWTGMRAIMWREFTTNPYRYIAVHPCLSRLGRFTYMSSPNLTRSRTRSPPPNTTLFICRDDRASHFVAMWFSDGCPIPPILHSWSIVRDDSVVGLEVQYEACIQEFERLRALRPQPPA